LKGKLYIQRTKSGARTKRLDAIECDLSLRDEQALAASGSNYLTLARARVDFISADGIMIHGLEESGPVNDKRVKYQEWWFTPN